MGRMYVEFSPNAIETIELPKGTSVSTMLDFAKFYSFLSSHSCGSPQFWGGVTIVICKGSGRFAVKQGIVLLAPSHPTGHTLLRMYVFADG
jgi:hypothetical protein